MHELTIKKPLDVFISWLKDWTVRSGAMHYRSVHWEQLEDGISHELTYSHGKCYVFIYCVLDTNGLRVTTIKKRCRESASQEDREATERHIADLIQELQGPPKKKPGRPPNPLMDKAYIEGWSYKTYLIEAENIGIRPISKKDYNSAMSYRRSKAKKKNRQ